MIFTETKLKGAYMIDLEPHRDDRGFLARTFCVDEFRQRGLNPKLVQTSISVNIKKGTLRGMHYQDAPFQEAKVVRCTRGALYDVIIDLRRDSKTFRQWTFAELTVDNRRMFYIPEHFAHGFQTLQDDTEILYYMSEFFHPESARGFRWDDPAFNIQWPIPQPILSPKDQSYPDVPL